MSNRNLKAIVENFPYNFSAFSKVLPSTQPSCSMFALNSWVAGEQFFRCHHYINGQFKLHRTPFQAITIAFGTAPGGQEYVTEGGFEGRRAVPVESPCLDILFRCLR
jgi:hypothetical protein